VTCATPSGPLGMTANSFASVSLNPPLVLWSPAKSSTRHPFFVAATHYAIHVLGEEQEDLCNAFARSGDAFGSCAVRYNNHGVPLIDRCLSRFECRQVAVHEGGDHSILIGHVEQVTTRDGAPLLFQGGRCGTFSVT
jgi:flavin reductase (DIM6/NTAB) family NADH-FMN oxidoreductase RutF